MDSVLNMFYENYEKKPDEVCVEDETGAFTWTELFAYACSVREFLKENDVQKQDSVTIELKNSKEFIACILACQMNGSIYIPSGVIYPPDRIKQIREISKAKLSITYEIFPELMKRYKEFCEANDNLEKVITASNFEKLSDDDIECINFTSGTSGIPKGVVFNVYNMYYSVRRAIKANLAYSEAKVILGVLPWNFVSGLQWAIADMVMGTKYYIAPIECLRNPNLLREQLIEKKVERLLLSPSLAKNINFNGTSVNTLSLGGERCSNAYIEGVDSIVNGYGCTETGGPILFYQLTENMDNTPVGKSVDETKIYLLDEFLQPSDEGEICVAGANTACYLNDEASTKKNYLKNPFKDDDGFEVLYKTGDMGKRLEDGNIVCLGRLDNMVKINGQRVELQDIESVLKTFDTYVKDCAVQYFKNENNKAFLVAYIVKNNDVYVDKLKADLKEKLPSYMVPNHYVFLDALPLNPAGKLDRRSLKPPSDKSSAEEYIVPSTDSEKFVCNAFKKVFDDDKVGVNFSFINHGGDSISAIQLLSILKDYPLSATDVLELDTLEKIAKYIDNSDNNDQINKIINQKVERYPLLDTTYLMYSFSAALGKIATKVTVFNIPYAFKISGIDEEKLKKCIWTTIDAHKGLKAKIEMHDDEPYFIRRDDWYPDWNVEEIDFEPDDNFGKKQVNPFDIFTDDLFRVHPYKYKDTFYVYFDIHHTVCDGASMSILFNDLIDTIYGKPIKNESVDALQYSLLLDHLLHSEVGENDKKYFNNLFSGLELKDVSNFKNNKLREKILKLSMLLNKPISYSIMQKEYDIDTVKNYCKKHGVNASNFFAAAFVYYFAGYSDSDLVFIGAESNKRTNSQSVGCVANIFGAYPIVYKRREGDTFERVLQDIQDQTFETFKHDFRFRQFSKFITEGKILYNYRAVNDSEKEIYKFDKDGIKMETVPLKAAHGAPKPYSIRVIEDKDKYIYNVTYQDGVYNVTELQSFLDKLDEFIRKQLDAE